MNHKKKYAYIIISSLIACILLYYVEQIVMANYVTKTLVKVVLFTMIPFCYFKLYKKSTFAKALHGKTLNKKELKIGFLLGFASFLILIITYILLKNKIHLQGIVQDLASKSITPTNFIYIAFYVTFVNSFLEEFFFRGFIFLNLYEMKFKKIAYLYSSLLFALYHIAIFKSWFNPWLLALALTGLLAVGFLFNFIDTKSKNFINSWIVHILADMAIVLIGMSILGFF